MWEVVLVGRHAVGVGDCKKQQLSPAGSLFSCKEGDEGGTEAGYSGRKPINPAILNRFAIFSILCFLVSHLQSFSFALALGLFLEGAPFLLKWLEELDQC